jgi:hypothetical protein
MSDREWKYEAGDDQASLESDIITAGSRDAAVCVEVASTASDRQLLPLRTVDSSDAVDSVTELSAWASLSSDRQSEWGLKYKSGDGQASLESGIITAGSRDAAG